MTTRYNNGRMESRCLNILWINIMNDRWIMWIVRVSKDQRSGKSRYRIINVELKLIGWISTIMLIKNNNCQKVSRINNNILTHNIINCKNQTFYIKISHTDKIIPYWHNLHKIQIFYAIRSNLRPIIQTYKLQ